MPAQVVAVAGQVFSLPINVSDADQDALHFSINGLPINATLTPSSTYGQALLTWTPTAGDIGNHDMVLTVTDSGLPPQNQGYTYRFTVTGSDGSASFSRTFELHVAK